MADETFDAVVMSVQLPNYPIEQPRKALTFDRYDRQGAENVLEEEVREDPLPDEAPLEVGEHAQDGVDLAGVRQLLDRAREPHHVRGVRCADEIPQFAGVAGATLVLAGEAPLRRFRVGIYETGVEKHRFGCLPVLAAIGPAANEFCSLPPRLGLGKVGLMAIIARH